MKTSQTARPLVKISRTSPQDISYDWLNSLIWYTVSLTENQPFTVLSSLMRQVLVLMISEQEYIQCVGVCLLAWGNATVFTTERILYEGTWESWEDAYKGEKNAAMLQLIKISERSQLKSDIKGAWNKSGLDHWRLFCTKLCCFHMWLRTGLRIF